MEGEGNLERGCEKVKGRMVATGIGIGGVASTRPPQAARLSGPPTRGRPRSRIVSRAPVLFEFPRVSVVN